MKCKAITNKGNLCVNDAVIDGLCLTHWRCKNKVSFKSKDYEDVRKRWKERHNKAGIF